MDPATIAAISGAVDTGVNAITQIGQNRKARQHQEYMYDKQNAYNTPMAQMQRFKDAGLNPHLIYGQGNSGNAGAPPPVTTQEAPKMNFMDITSNYVAQKRQQTEIDNLEKARQVMEADRILKGASTVNALSASAKTDQERHQAEMLFDTVAAQQKLNLHNSQLAGQKTEVDIQKTRSDIDAVKASTKLTEAQKLNVEQSIRESQQRIQNLKKDASSKDRDIIIKDLDIQLKRNGIQPSDPLYQRVIGRVLGGESPKRYIDKQNDRFGKKIQEFKNLFSR